jgi:hypothetical protein
MKKLIAISVMIALIAGAVFAETSVSGNVEARLNLFRATFGSYEMELSDGSTFDPYDGSYPKPLIGGGAIAASAIKLAGSADDGTMGGALRVRYHYISAESFRWSQAFIWWRPIPQMRLWLGVDDDGMFGTGQLTDWAFHQGSESYLTVHNWDWWREIFPGNWDTFGAALSFYLVPGLDLNLVIPTGQPGGWPRHKDSHNARSITFQELPGNLQLTTAYGIPDVGKFYLAWIGSGQDYLDEPTTFGRIGFSFFSNALVDGLQFQVGGSTVISKAADDGGADEPVWVGLAIHFASGNFGLKFRVGSKIQTSEAGGLYLTGNIMPNFNLGIGRVCLDIGFAMNQADSDADSDVGFWINPYLKKGLGAGYFQIGVMVLNNIDGGQGDNHNVKIDDHPRVYIPMLMGFNF